MLIVTNDAPIPPSINVITAGVSLESITLIPVMVIERLFGQSSCKCNTMLYDKRH